MSDTTPEQGARNLLKNCAHAQSGEHLLIAYEPADLGYYDENAVPVVTRAAKDIGMTVDVLDVGFNPDDPHLTPELKDAMQKADVVLFLARLGDQLRFSDMPANQRIVVSFALNKELFGSGFGNGHHEAFLQLKQEIDTLLATAQDVHVTCPAGTDFHGRPHMPTTEEGDVSIMRFPMSVFTPVPANSFSGKVALCGFLTGTGSKYYDDYTVEFEGPLLAHFTDGRLTGFSGDDKDVALAEQHYDRVATMFGIDRNMVHSWHAGIHPGCGFPWEARGNYERWGGSAFGNPRILHFHTCGAYAPGEISWNLIDPTIEIDGVRYWDKGVFHAERLPNGADILARYSCAAALFSSPTREIGLETLT